MKNKDLELWDLVKTTARDYAVALGFKPLRICPPKKHWRGRYMGSCSKRGIIRIAIRDNDGKRMEAYHIIDTIAHEIAHFASQKHNSVWFSMHVKVLSQLHHDGVYERLKQALKKK